VSSVFFFFFQAEDGIRDWSVTGVQTCALPISLAAFASRSSTSLQAGQTGLRTLRLVATHAPHQLQSGVVWAGATNTTRLPAHARSEERRVGKEGRDRGGADGLKRREGETRAQG